MRFREQMVRPFVMLLFASGTLVAAPPQSEWPKTIPLGERKVILDAPHAESLEGTTLEARGVFGFQKPGETEPVWGSIWYEAEVTVDREHRTVTLASVTVPRLQLAGMPAAQQERLAARLGPVITRRQIRLGLDDVLASVRTAKWRTDAPPKLGTEPPVILFESEPAILLVYDGEPRFRAVEGSKLERVMNSAFLVLHDPEAKAYFLDGGTSWFRASDPKGPWETAGDVPAAALSVARHDREEAGVAEKDVEKAGEGEDKRVPKIVVATVPTELIVSDGPPAWSPAVGDELEAMSSSESAVFRTPADRKIWIVLSGRWYQSDALTGPWTFVEPDRLPASFRRIPADSPKASVLAFVPGTGPAREALEDAGTPRTAAVRRKDAHVTVTYDGDPRFESVPGTHVSFAINTAAQVLLIDGRYFACDQGVWFSSGSATGPWQVADAIPEEEIQALPPESPVYSTKFVTIYDATPEVVYTAYTPAYLGSYPYRGTVFFGTGWAYRPWWGAYYYPRPWTWGFHPWYHPWVGWGFGASWGRGWAGFRYGFGLGWGTRWCGPAGFYRPAFVNVNRNVSITRNVSVTRNVYASGANTARATTTQAAARGASTTKTAPARTGAAKSAGAGTHTGGKKAGAGAGKPAAGTAKGGAKTKAAPKGGGGAKKR